MNLKEIVYPKYLSEENCWAISTENGLEKGCLEYVLGEVCRDGLVYHYNTKRSSPDHSHTFSGVLEQLVRDPKAFSIAGYEDDYSLQEQAFIKKIQNELLNRLKSISQN